MAHQAGLASAETVVSPVTRRPRWRSYLLLARVSNLPTVWSNVLAGTVGGLTVGGGLVFERPSAALWTVAAASLFYTGGMFLNDAFDARHDRRARPERPIPRGDVGVREALAVGALCLLLGGILLWPSTQAMILGGALAAAIVLYDARHKAVAWAPIVMGLCRGLVYAIAAAAVGNLPTSVVVGGLLMAAYVASLTLVAKRAGANARWLVPALIAGISLVDAAFILAVSGRLELSALAALGFPLTLSLQRWVPGD